MDPHAAIRALLTEQARTVYGPERAAALTATLDRLAAAFARVAAFPVALSNDPFPTSPPVEEEPA